ncbi:MAG: hypothetical protein WCE24_18940, partial [Pseudolabrys sp.]
LRAIDHFPDSVISRISTGRNFPDVIRVPMPADRAEYPISSNLVGSAEFCGISTRIFFAPGRS